jgi:hypothetical protein
MLENVLFITSEAFLKTFYGCNLRYDPSKKSVPGKPFHANFKFANKARAYFNGLLGRRLVLRKNIRLDRKGFPEGNTLAH